MVNHHPDFPLSEYQKLGDIVNSKSEIYKNKKDGSICFLNKSTQIKGANFVALRKNESDKIVFWKTNFYTTGKLSNTYEKIRLGDYSKSKGRIGTDTPQISQSEDNSDSAISPAIHGRSDTYNISQPIDSVKENDKTVNVKDMSLKELINERDRIHSQYDNDLDFMYDDRVQEIVKEIRSRKEKDESKKNEDKKAAYGEPIYKVNAKTKTYVVENDVHKSIFNYVNDLKKSLLG